MLTLVAHILKSVFSAFLLAVTWIEESVTNYLQTLVT